MEAVLIKSFTFLSIVLLGYILKTKGFFKKEDSQLISKIVSRITLPCAVLGSAVQLTFTQVTIVVMMVAVVTDLTMGLVGKLAFAKKSNVERASAIVNTSGYNVANVTIPFVQAFFPGVGMGYVCMFDIGNSIGWLGLTVAWGKSEADENARFNVKHLIHTLLHSIPFLTYILIFTLGVLKLSLPMPVASIVTTIGSANSFLVMLMIGMMIDFEMTKEQFLNVFKIVGLRLVGFIIFSIFIIFLLPVPMLAKTVLLLCIVPSAPSISIVFSKELGDESAIPAFINSISLLLGIICSTIVLLFSV